MFELIRNKNLSLIEKISFIKISTEKVLEPKKIDHFSFGESSFSEEKIPKIIWMYWEDDNFPYLVKECVEAVKKLHPDYEFNLLNRSTINNYITIINWNASLPTPNFSDLVRLELISKFGGIWLDASSIVFESFEEIFSKIEIKLNGLILFYNPLTTSKKEFPILESWFIAAPPNNRFINEWLFEFKRCINSPNPLTYYKDRNDYKDLIQKIDNADYLLVYVAAQVVLRENFSKQMTVIDAGSLGCYYWFRNGKYPFDTRYYAKILSVMNAPAEISPFIKLTGVCRKYLHEYNQLGVVNRNSIISKFLEKNRN